MRASRLVSLLLLLQTRGGMTAAELARELEVSVRTVHRDVEELSVAGIPIYAERGPHGGVRLVDGYRTRLTGLTVEEAEALFLSGLPGPAAELGLGTVVAAARLKVLAALPPELRTRASRLSERFHLDAPGWFQGQESAKHVELLAGAVWDGVSVEIDYDRGDRDVPRRLDPLGLVLKAGIWYLVARSEDQIRTYRMSRIVRAKRLDEPFERPGNFDLAGFWAESSAAYERDLPRIDVSVRVRPDGIDSLMRAVGERAVAAATELDEPDPDGWRRLRLRLSWPREAAGQLLGAGPDVEVIDPPDIRAQVVANARLVVERYGV
jgi:predicted DNA-binding transcriptional regulator YafY